MAAYSFEAIDAQGKACRGVIDAESAKAARSLLRARALVPLAVQAVGADAATNPRPDGLSGRRGQRVFNATQLAIWTRQLAGLVLAGLPLEKALSSLSQEAERVQERDLVAALRAEVNAGSLFARALAQYPREFSQVYVAVVAAGEQSAQLGEVLERLADDLEEQHNLRNKLLGAALYPSIVSVVAVLIVLFLMTYVVPQVAHVFASSKRALPLLTVVMLGISRFVRDYGWLLAAGLLLSGVLARLALAREDIRIRFDAMWLTLPILGRLARSYNAARFAGTLAMLSSAGVPILKALQAATETLSNQALRRDAQDAGVLVREGAPLASALAQKKRFPPMLSMFSRLGEQTGQLPAMLQRASAQLSHEVQRRAMRLATLLEPLLIVAMGMIVMLIVLAVLLPIIELNQLVR